MSDKKSRIKEDRTRNWTFIAYPESAPDNWRDVLNDEHIQWIESPLHDKDKNQLGEVKKEHWHILLLFEGKKSFGQIKEITDKLNASIPQKVASAKGLVRYMIHLDDPDKCQYEKDLIIGHGGVDIEEYLKPTSSSRYQLIGEMRQWIVDNKCTEFFELFDYAASDRFSDWFPLLCDNSAYIMGEYIKSCRFSRGIKVIKVDTQTGEVIE